MTVLLFLGLPLVVTLAWYQGHRALKRVSRTELTIIAALLVLAGTALWHFARSPQEAGSKIDIAAQKHAALPPAMAKAPERSIAVLPFLDLSEKKNQEYFADGMAEEILNLLVKIPELKVIGRTSSFQFKGKTDDLRKIGAALGTAYVVEGSVRRSGNHVRVTAQLIDTRDGAHRWSDTYDRSVSDVLKVQGEIAAGLVRALQLEVAPVILMKAHSSPRSVEAYELYLRGLHASTRYDQPGFEEAVADFRQALELDPSFVPAAEALAINFSYQAAWAFIPSQVGWEQARRAAESTLKLDPKSARAHSVLGDVLLEYDWNWLAAQRELDTSVSLAPRDPAILEVAGAERLAMSKYNEALSFLDAAVAADPLDANMYWHFLMVYLRLGRLPEAETAARRVLELSPTYAWGHYYVGLVLLIEGRATEALAEMQKETEPSAQTMGFAVIYQALHRKRDADIALARFESEHAEDQAMFIAEVYAFRGQKDRAFDWLDRAYAQKDYTLYYVKGEPLLKPLETDLRYKAFLRRMNLPE